MNSFLRTEYYRHRVINTSNIFHLSIESFLDSFYFSSQVCFTNHFGTDLLIDQFKMILIAFERMSTNHLKDNGRDSLNLRTILDHAIDVEYKHACYNQSLSNIINHIAFRKFIEQVSILFERRGRSVSVFFFHSHNGSVSSRHSSRFLFFFLSFSLIRFFIPTYISRHIIAFL